MSKILLQSMIENLKFEDLPSNWTFFDLESFSKKKKLWDYQQEAIKNAIKVLYKYFEYFGDYKEKERLEENEKRKEKFFNWYKNNELAEESVDINLDRNKRKINSLLIEYYPKEDGRISYKHFINRMGFWMATGSGKSLVIIKLIQILGELMERKEIPPWDILFLTHRDDLIEQLKKHLEEFNYDKERRIIFKELKEYPQVKACPLLSKDITLFYYRSDNLSDEQKERIIDFRNYDKEGKWYIFLDEAHKGDKEDSKRQHIYSILSRNGFLFNFSATFTDIRDIITCAFEFNLSQFINKGYGKHISILKQEIREFREEEDYNDEEKQKIVLKSLILLTYIKKFYEDIRKIQQDLYHKPLLLTLVNSVNTEDADLKLFFRQLEKIGEGEVAEEVFEKTREELWEELREEPPFLFEEKRANIEERVFKSITLEDVLKYVYNSSTFGEIEVLIRPSDKKELAFKLKTSEKPFALIKIGDISGWLKNEFEGYEIQERFEEESYFESLNREDSEINILMGSRSFYEGWDSNRPNVINFINIGLGEEAKKFILQSVGRGVRIEPVKGKRKRLLELYNGKEIGEDLFNKVKDKVLPIETLFIFGTNRNALETVLEELKKVQIRRKENILSLYVNEEKKDKLLLIPIYKSANDSILWLEEKEINRKMKFEISEKEFELVKKFSDFISDDRIFLMRYNAEPIKKIKFLKDCLKSENNFKFVERSFKNIDLLIQRFFDYLSVVPEEFDKFKELEEEIRHFKNIKVYLEDIYEIKNKVNRVKDYPKKMREVNEQYGKITREEYDRMRENVRREETFERSGRRITIKYVANHYYLPLILTREERIDYIKHIIKTPSEVNFINDLEEYLNKDNNRFKELDWWLFSKIDESLDEVYIPYYNPQINRITKFYPDFIFWLKKGNNYFIIFVDPKGIEHISGWIYKINGYKELFEGKEFSYNELKVRIYNKFRTTDNIPDEYKQYWFNRIEEMLNDIL